MFVYMINSCRRKIMARGITGLFSYKLTPFGFFEKKQDLFEKSNKFLTFLIKYFNAKMPDVIKPLTEEAKWLGTMYVSKNIARPFNLFKTFNL